MTAIVKSKSPDDRQLARALKRKKRKEGRKKREQRLKSDPAFAKAYFEAKSKRSSARKVAFKRRYKQK